MQTVPRCLFKRPVQALLAVRNTQRLGNEYLVAWEPGWPAADEPEAEPCGCASADGKAASADGAGAGADGAAGSGPCSHGHGSGRGGSGAVSPGSSWVQAWHLWNVLGHERFEALRAAFEAAALPAILAASG